MKRVYRKVFAIAALGMALALTPACSHQGHNHAEEGHNHAEEGHNHDEEGHDHEGHNHAEGEECHDHEGEEGHEGHENHEHGAGEGAEAEKHANEVVMTPEALKSAKLKVQKIEPMAFREAVKCSGVIETSRGGERVLVAPASGVVTFGNGVVNGAQVGAGQTLFHISSKGLEQGDAAANVQIDKALAEKELKRAEELIKDNLISRKEYDRIRTEYERAKAGAASVAARNRAGMSVSTPISGALVNVTVRPGSFVNMGDPLGTVVVDRRLVLKADMSERDRWFADHVVGANILVPGTDQVVELGKLGARVLSSRPTTDSRSHFIPVYIEFNNPGGLGNGSVVEVWLLGSRREGVLSVPRSALVEEGGMFYVYVQEAQGVFEKVEVKRGASDGARVEILSGLEPGSKVVIDGALKVRLAGMGSSIQGHSHNH